MKLVLLFILSFSAYSMPQTGEYQYCYSSSGSEPAYLNIVQFEKLHYGIQMYHENFPISFQVVLDGEERSSVEAISGMPFRYKAGYANNLLKIVFENPAKAEAIGLKPVFLMKFEGDLATFTFNYMKLFCRRRAGPEPTPL